MWRCGDAIDDIDLERNPAKKICFELENSCSIHIVTLCATYHNNSLNSANIVNNNQKKDRAITCAWQKLYGMCNLSHDRLPATRATSHMTGCMQPLQPLQPVTWQVACNPCNQSHDRLRATRATSHMTGCMQPLQPVQPVTHATCHVTGCTLRASIRSVRQKLLSKCGGAVMRRRRGVVEDINSQENPNKNLHFRPEDCYFIYITMSYAM